MNLKDIKTLAEDLPSLVGAYEKSGFLASPISDGKLRELRFTARSISQKLMLINVLDEEDRRAALHVLINNCPDVVFGAVLIKLYNLEIGAHKMLEARKEK